MSGQCPPRPHPLQCPVTPGAPTFWAWKFYLLRNRSRRREHPQAETPRHSRIPSLQWSNPVMARTFIILFTSTRDLQTGHALLHPHSVLNLFLISWQHSKESRHLTWKKRWISCISQKNWNLWLDSVCIPTWQYFLYVQCGLCYLSQSLLSLLHFYYRLGPKVI
jgi:hypothetical protein